MGLEVKQDLKDGLANLLSRNKFDRISPSINMVTPSVGENGEVKTSLADRGGNELAKAIARTVYEQRRSS